MAKFYLYLVDSHTPNTHSPSLSETIFEHPLAGRLRCIRGRNMGIFGAYGSFPWTSAVVAMTKLLLYTAAHEKGDKLSSISGTRGSEAASLDFSISKTPVWLQDMLGMDSAGRPLVKRIFHRINPERKRPGPVTIAINTRELAPEDIVVFLNGMRIKNSDNILQLAQCISLTTYMPNDARQKYPNAA